MHIIGRGRYAREAYPEPNRATSVLAALTNRYLVSPAAQATPSAFTVTQPSFHAVAAVNVTRRASGLFVLSVQMPSDLAAADTQEWSAIALFGSTASGGVANGDWLLDIASAITTSLPTGASPMALDVIQSDATTLDQSVTLAGINPAPVPQGNSAIVILANTVGGTQITPGIFLGAVFELP